MMNINNSKYMCYWWCVFMVLNKNFKTCCNHITSYINHIKCNESVWYLWMNCKLYWHDLIKIVCSLNMYGLLAHIYIPLNSVNLNRKWFYLVYILLTHIEKNLFSFKCSFKEKQNFGHVLRNKGVEWQNHVYFWHKQEPFWKSLLNKSFSE